MFVRRWETDEALCGADGERCRGKSVLTVSLLPAERGTDTICLRAAALSSLYCFCLVGRFKDLNSELSVCSSLPPLGLQFGCTGWQVNHRERKEQWLKKLEGVKVDERRGREESCCHAVVTLKLTKGKSVCFCPGANWRALQGGKTLWSAAAGCFRTIVLIYGRGSGSGWLLLLLDFSECHKNTTLEPQMVI